MSRKGSMLSAALVMGAVAGLDPMAALLADEPTRKARRPMQQRRAPLEQGPETRQQRRYRERQEAKASHPTPPAGSET